MQNNFFRTFTLGLVILITLNLKAQELKMNSYIITEDDQKLYYDYKDIGKIDNSRFYTTRIPSKDTKVEIASKDFHNAKIDKTPNYLYVRVKSKQYRIIAFNKDFILVEQNYTTNEVLQVLDRKFNKVSKYCELRKTLGDIGLKGVIKKNLKQLNEIVAPYFKDCPEVINPIVENIKQASNTGLFSGTINNYNCDNSEEVYDGEKIDENEITLSSSDNDENIMYGIKKTGEKIEFMSHPNSVTKGGFQYFYKDENGDIKSKTNYYKLWSNFFIGKKVILPFEGMENTHYEVVVFNDKYILTTQWVDRELYKSYKSESFNIHSRDKKVLESDIKRDDLNNVINKYFGDCTELKEKIAHNILRGALAIDDIYYYNCNGATDILTEEM